MNFGILFCELSTMKRSLKLLIQTSTSLYQWTQLTLVRTVSNSVLTQIPLTQLTDQEHTHLIKSLEKHTHMNQILTQLIVKHTPINHFSLTKLIDISVSSHGFGSISLLFIQFHSFLHSDLCNSIIRSYTQSNNHSLSVFIYTQMFKIGVLPNSSTFPAILKSASQLCCPDVGKSVHCCVIKLGSDLDIYTNTALVHLYLICSLSGDARRLFDEMPERNVVSWNALLTGFTHNRKFREAIDVFQEMLVFGAAPGEVTVVGVLSACAHLGALDQGRWVHDYIIRSRLKMNVFVGTALIDMYAKCGVMDEAEKVFGEMRVKNVYTWNVMISGYAMNGRGDASLHAFSRMVMEQYRPDEVTFLAILSACCHQGFVEEGRRHFRSMKEEFRLHPRIEHYGCMVDLLGRAGFLEDALRIIGTMNLKPDPIIWRALLGACRIHKNTQLGEYAMKNLLALEPENGENYILLSNLYARDQRWAKVGEVREMMDSKNIRKISGCSSIEIAHVVYEFVASDITEPEHEEVYKLLDDIKKQLKVSGYSENTDMVLYDLEEEEKERTLIYHSEKLALAFGLLKSPSDTMLRIVKNLRICQDCHGFFKLVSMIYSRDIVVRDRNRFHHFVGGVCSCKDYW